MADSPRETSTPVFIVAAGGTETTFLVQALSVEPRLAVATVSAGRGVASSLAEHVSEARFVFVAGRSEEQAPEDLGRLDPGRWCRVERDAMLGDPRAGVRALCEFLEIEYDQALLGPVEAARRDALVAQAGEGLSPFASVSTETFGRALAQSASSLLISTYQTNRLVCVRAARDGVNTHFRAYDKPMGLAVGRGRFAMGTRTEVWDLRDMPEAAAKLAPPTSHDACYLPRNVHLTGDIAVHELAFAGDELWVVATAFSCLATLDIDHSFVPRWTPQFITRLTPEDRCHLNGLAIRDERPAYVTALGQSDEPGGWRAAKADGGVLIDVSSSEVLIAGLSMPHSPRWYQERLWLLESGKGELCVADPDSGSVETVAELPGFTRGLAFADGIAFVGLSQIRESATFGDLPLTHRPRERQSGVWMVDLTSGAVAGFLRFEDLVQEIFDVAILPGTRFPEIAEPHGTTTAHSYALP